MTLDTLALFQTSLLMLAVGYLASISGKLDQRTTVETIEKPFAFITMAIWFFGFVGVVASIGLWVWTLFF